MAIGDVSVSTFNVLEGAGWVIVFDVTGGDAAAPLKVKDSTTQSFYVRSIQLACSSMARPCIWDGSVGSAKDTPKKLTPRLPTLADPSGGGTTTSSWVFNPPIKTSDCSSIVYDCSVQGWFGGIIQGYTGI